MNRDGPALLGLASGWTGVAAISIREAHAAAEDGAILIDLRDAEAFCRSHPAGALNIAYGPRVGYWAGWIVPAGARIVLFGSSPDEASEAGRQLIRVNLDGVVGHVDASATAWEDAGLPTASIERLTPLELHNRMADPATPIKIVDVRTAQEWRDGHIPGSINLPVGDLATHVPEFDSSRVVATICESGYRSALAASILARAPVGRVITIRGGMAEVRRIEATERGC